MIGGSVFIDGFQEEVVHNVYDTSGLSLYFFSTTVPGDELLKWK